MRRDAHGRGEDRFRDAERCGEDDALRGTSLEGEVLGESGHVLDVGSPEAVDRLIGVGRRGQVPVFGSEALQQDGLGMGGVLIFVDEEMAVLVRDCIDDGRIAEKARCLGEQGSVIDE